MPNRGCQGVGAPKRSANVLIVDDDPNVTRRWAKEFVTSTSLRPVQANTLKDARNILFSDTVSIDALVVDLFFGAGADDPEFGLFDGVDFLNYVNLSGLKLPMFVISASSEMMDYKDKAAKLRLPIVEFFDKLVAGDRRDPAWNRIERLVIEGSNLEEFSVPPAIIQRLLAGKCVAFVGAGFSALVGMPSWDGLLRTLLDFSRRHNRDLLQIRQCQDAIENDEYGIAANIIHELLESSEIFEVLQRSFGQHVMNRVPPELRQRMEVRLQSLLRGPWSGIITTNYDGLLESAFERWTDGCWRVAEDHSRQLGTILLQPDQAEKFFVKIHGSLSISNFVLSTQEYNEVYLRSNKISNFLKAVMMKYHLVFIGCSLEDHILDIRRQLALDYDGNIPMSYAIVPESRRNLRRAPNLRKEYAIDCIFYPEGQHQCLDHFLAETSGLDSRGMG
jgi:hypothetical protein